MSRNFESTKVLFPRFEVETPVDGSIRDRELVEIAQPSHWMIESDFDRLCHPSTNTNAGPLQRHFDKLASTSKWWGLQHSTRVSIPLGMLVSEEPDSVPHASDPNSLYRYQHIRHYFHWDSQSVPGNRDEVVLERLTLGGFRQVLAMLSDPARKGEQQLVRADEGGHWYEPDYVNISRDLEREFYLGVMADMAKQTWDDFKQEVDEAVTSGSS